LQDKKDASHTIGMLYQGGLGMPDRDYYFDEDKVEQRGQYQSYIQQVFALLGASGVTEYSDERQQQEAAKQVLELEVSLAASHLTRTSCRDPELTYNKKSLEQVRDMCCSTAAKRHQEDQRAGSAGVSWAGYLTRAPPLLAPPPLADVINSRFNWEEYFRLIGKDKETLGDLNVATISGIERAFEILSLPDTAPGLQHYLVFHTALSFSEGHLPRAFKQAHFDFYEKALKGTSDMKPRWKTVLAALEVIMI
jgi:putative endopeptidase